MTIQNTIGQSTALFSDTTNCCWVGVGADGNNVTGDSTSYTVVYTSASVNQGSPLVTGTGIATMPVAGLYLIGGTISLSGLLTNTSNAVILNFVVNGSTSYQPVFQYSKNATSGLYAVNGLIFYKASANDTVKMTVQALGQGAGTVSVTGAAQNTWFYGVLIA